MKCRPSLYAVVGTNGVLTHGWRCAKHNIPSMRYSTEELRDQRAAEHQAEALEPSSG